MNTIQRLGKALATPDHGNNLSEIPKVEELGAEDWLSRIGEMARLVQPRRRPGRGAPKPGKR